MCREAPGSNSSFCMYDHVVSGGSGEILEKLDGRVVWLGSEMFIIGRQRRRGEFERLGSSGIGVRVMSMLKNDDVIYWLMRLSHDHSRKVKEHVELNMSHIF